MYKKYFENLPSWSRGVISVIGVGAAAFITYQIYSKIKNAKELAKSLAAQKLADTELADLKKQGQVPTKSTSQFEIMSAKIVEAINDCGTDEDAILSVFKSLNNRADLLLLISVFGVRYYRPCAISEPVTYLRYQIDNKSYAWGLSTFISHDLDNSEIAKLNNILQTKKIDFTF